MLTICIIADTHQLHRSITIPECDLLIHCGDFCNFLSDEQATLSDADQWFGEVPAKQVVCIGGNHDSILEKGDFKFTNAIYLEDSAITIAGLKIYGAPWCPNLMGFAFYGSEVKLQQKWSAIPSDVDILVTHSPPLGILDDSSRIVGLGCSMLREQLERISPKYHFFGHIHASSGMKKCDGIQFVNAAVVGGANFDVKNSAYQLEVGL